MAFTRSGTRGPIALTRMRNPTVTVCIATRNHREWIDQCVRSAVEQDAETELQVLVGDDASDDGTSDIVFRLAKIYPGQITHLRRNPRLGAYGNMRDLLTRADGDFTACIDGDDYWLPGKLKQQLAFLHAHADCEAVFTNAVTVDAAGNRIGLFNDVGDARFDLAAMLRNGNFLNNSSILFRRGGLAKCLTDGVPVIDYCSHLWLARGGWLGQIGEPLTAYRVNTRDSMVAGMNDRVRELYWEAIQSVPRELVSDDDYAHGIADFMRRVVLRAVRTRQWSLLRSWLPRVFAASPYGQLHTGALTLASIARITCKAGAGLFRRGPDGQHLHVLYRH